MLKSIVSTVLSLSMIALPSVGWSQTSTNIDSQLHERAKHHVRSLNKITNLDDLFHGFQKAEGAGPLKEILQDLKQTGLNLKTTRLPRMYYSQGRLKISGYSKQIKFIDMKAGKIEVNGIQWNYDKSISLAKNYLNLKKKMKATTSASATLLHTLIAPTTAHAQKLTKKQMMILAGVGIALAVILVASVPVAAIAAVAAKVVFVAGVTIKLGVLIAKAAAFTAAAGVAIYGLDKLRNKMGLGCENGRNILVQPDGSRVAESQFVENYSQSPEIQRHHQQARRIASQNLQIKPTHSLTASAKKLFAKIQKMRCQKPKGSFFNRIGQRRRQGAIN